MNRRVRTTTILAVALSGPACAGAWPQPEDYGFALNQAGIAFDEFGNERIVFDGYGEAGLGNGFTGIFAFDSDLDRATPQYVWRGGAGLRFSFRLDEAPNWRFSVEGMVRYQGHEGAVEDPVFAGDGIGGGLRFDAGRSFDISGLHAFANLAVGYVYRRRAPAETRLEIVSGIDLSPSWQAGGGYAATFAPGAFFEAGAYEKHEAQAWLRWRIDEDYALSVSVTQTLAADRAPRETAVRLALWTFFYPEVIGD